MAHPTQLQSPEGRKLLTALRKVTAELPGTTETIDGFGHTTFKVGSKSFVIAGMGEEGTAISIKSDLVTQDALIRRGPYYRTPYIGQHGWISIESPLSHDWKDAQALIIDAHRLVAPKQRRAKAPNPQPKAKKPARKQR